MSKHTPGPWKCTPIDDRLVNHRRGYEISGPETARSIRDVREDEIAPNAALIAAAPEMVDALKLARDRIQQFYDREAWATDEEILKVLRAALWKAGIS